MKKQTKSGMYGEMPQFKIGRFSISLISDRPKEKTVWIADTIRGDGGQFSIRDLEKTVSIFYKKHF